MAQYSTGNNLYSGPFAASILDGPTVSALDWTHKPQVLAKLIDRYPDQYDLGFLMAMDMMEEVVLGDDYIWIENNKFMKQPTIAAIANTGTYINLTYDAASHENSGTQSYGRVNEVVILPNGLQGQVWVKDVSTPNAHFISLKPVGYQADGVTAVTLAQLATGLTVGGKISFIGNAFSEGSVGQKTSVVTTQTSYQNFIQNMSDTMIASFNEMTNQSWVGYPLPTQGGLPGSFYYNKVLWDTEMRVQRDVMTTWFIGAGGLVNDPNDPTKNERLTNGIYTTAAQMATPYPYARIAKSYFDGIKNITNRNFSGKEFDILAGNDFLFKSQDFQIDYQKNRDQSAPNDTIKTEIRRIEIGGNGYNIIPFQIFSDPYSLNNVANKKFSGMGMIIPAGKNVDKMGKATPMTQMRYKPRINPGVYNGKNWFGMEMFGYNSPRPTDSRDVREIHFKYSIGAEAHRQAEWIISQPMV